MSCHSVTVQFHVPHLDIIGSEDGIRFARPLARECTADEIAITFFGGFRARLREFKLGRSAPDWRGRAAGNGVNGSLILSRSKQLKRRMLNGRFLITRGELSSSFSSLFLSRQRLKQKL